MQVDDARGRRLDPRPEITESGHDVGDEVFEGPRGPWAVVPLGGGVSEKDLIVHDSKHPNPAFAFLLSRMDQTPGFPTPIGVLRAVDAPPYEVLVNGQVREMLERKGRGDLGALLRAGDTWEVR